MKMRPLQKVMDAVLNAVPNEWDGKLNYKGELLKIRYNALFTAPELYQNLWLDFCKATARHIGEIDTPWKQIVSGIIRNEIDYNVWLTNDNLMEKEDE